MVLLVGAAPWHDDLVGLGRVAAMLRPGSARLFTSLDLWDICAWIAHSRAYAGSSLHGRIVAAAFALPRVGLRSPACGGRPGKQAAFAATWRVVPACRPRSRTLAYMAEALHVALVVAPDRLQHQARRLARLHRAGFTAICAGSIGGQGRDGLDAIPVR